MTDPGRTARYLGLVLLLGAVGVGGELVLIEHDEDWRELVPIVVCGLAAVVVGWHLLAPTGASRLGVRVAMAALVVSGVAGLWLHFESNFAFEEELNPELGFWGLVLATMRSHSPPSLGPGVLALLGAIGWIATLRRTPPPHDDTTT